jgi:16S rRNA processing protein RimM
LKGEVRIEQMLEDDAVFEPGQRVVLMDPSKARSERRTEIEFFRRQHGRCIAKFLGIDSISEAEKYIGQEVKIPADDLPAPRAGWFYTFQLKGCQVLTTSGEYLGTVEDVLGSGGNEILRVDHEGRETLIPFAEPYVKRIDPGQHRIEVDLPVDLRDLNK